MGANPVFRCRECRAVYSHAEVCDKGFCDSCGGIEWKLAYKISDAEVKALEERGYVFDPQGFDDEAV